MPRSQRLQCIFDHRHMLHSDNRSKEQKQHNREHSKNVLIVFAFSGLFYTLADHFSRSLPFLTSSSGLALWNDITNIDQRQPENNRKQRKKNENGE